MSKKTHKKINFVGNDLRLYKVAATQHPSAMSRSGFVVNTHNNILTNSSDSGDSGPFFIAFPILI